MPEPSTWLLTARERGNPATRLDDRHAGGEAWSTGNEVSPLVHGAAYFADLAAEVRKLRAGDLQLVTDWRGDADERLAGDGRTVAEICATPHGAAYWSGPWCGDRIWTSSSSASGKTGTWVRTSKRRPGNACQTCGYGPAARTTRSPPCSATMDGRRRMSRSSITPASRPMSAEVIRPGVAGRRSGGADGMISGTHKVPISALTGIARPPPVSRRPAARRR